MTCRHCGLKKACRPRGLCWGCYRTPAALALYPRDTVHAGRALTPDDLARHAAADLELLAALLGATGSGLDYGEWTRLLAPFTPRARRVVVLRGLMGMQVNDIGERLGVSRARVGQLWSQALPKLAALAPAIRGVRAPSERRDDRHRGSGVRVRAAVATRGAL
jgi:DNA-binding NarL/FixJ family response regulator